MSQIIEGIDNEVTLVFFFLSVLTAVIVPFYILRPNTSVTEEDSSNTGEHGQQGNESSEYISARDQRHSETDHINESTAPSSHPPDGGGIGSNVSTSGTARNLYPSLDENSSENSSSSSNGPPAGADIQDGENTGRPGVSANPESVTHSDGHTDMISIKVMLHETSQTVTVSRNITLGDLKRICFPTDYAAGKTIRLIYHGRLLNGDTYPLRYLGIMNNYVLHASIADTQPSPQSTSRGETTAQPANLDLSGLFVPLLVAIVSLMWAFVFVYGGAFSATSITILGFLTVLFAMFSFLA